MPPLQLLAIVISAEPPNVFWPAIFADPLYAHTIAWRREDLREFQMLLRGKNKLAANCFNGLVGTPLGLAMPEFVCSGAVADT